MKENNVKMPKAEIFRYFLLFLYFVSISAFRLGVGFDAVFVRVIFVVMLISTFFMRKKILVSGVLVWNICFWVLFFASSLWAADPSYVFDKVAIFIQIVGLFFFLPFYITDKKSLNLVLKILVASLVVSAIILLIRTPVESLGIERLGDVIGLNSNALGLRMSIGAIISLYLFHNTKNDEKFKKIAYITIMILFFVMVLFSGSRKALFAVVVGILAYEIFIAKGIKTVVKIIGAAIAVVAVCLLIFNNEQLYDIIGSRVERTFVAIEGGAGGINKDHSLQERQFYIDQATELFKEHPVLGYGGNNFAVRMSEINYSHIAYSHNNYTEILSNLGIVGFMVYYVFWFFVICGLCKIYIRERKKNLRNSVVLLSLILIVILAVLDFGMVSYDAEFNMVILCLVYMCYLLYKNNKLKEGNE